MDPRFNRLADLLLDYSLEVKEGQTILVRSPIVAEPLIQALVAGAARRGVHLLTQLMVEDHQYLSLTNATDDLLDKMSKVELSLWRQIDGLISISASTNPRELSKVDPAKMARRAVSTKPLYKIIDKRESEGKFKWVIAPFPTPAMAGDAEMSLTEYADFALGACACNKANPVNHWRKVRDQQQKIVKVFNKAKKLHIIGKETDLTMSVAGRTWVNCCGDRNMPDGEVFTSPVENSVEGHIYFDYPACYRGVEVHGVRLTLEKGKVVKATAEKGEDYLLQMLDMDKGARFVGEIAIGTNFNIKQFSKSILFDEKIGGTMHMAVGRSIPESGGQNPSSLHWDMIKGMRDGGRWELDGKVVYRNGKFKI